MPTVIGHHDVKDTDHWLASSKREEFFAPLGITNIRTFVNPQNRTQVAMMMDVADMDALAAAMETLGGRRGDGARRRAARDARDPRRGLRVGQAATRRNENPAPVLRRDVVEGLGERPPVAGEILGCVLPLAVLEVDRLHHDERAVGACLLAVRGDVVDAHHHRVRHLARAGWLPLAVHVADDHRPVTDLELGAVVLADPDPLDEPERRPEPGDRLPHVRIDEDGNDRGRRDRAIRFHASSGSDPSRYGTNRDRGSSAQIFSYASDGFVVSRATLAPCRAATSETG